ncbi:MAG: hypothetical protein ACXVJ2_17025 [Candidatus Angelobacter sp.]
MKKLLTIAFTLLLGASLSFAQAGGGSGDKEAGTKKTAESGKKATKSAKKGHKGGKKSKKGAESTTTPPK